MKRKPSSLAPETDFARLDAMSDDEIDTSEIPELSPEFFARAIVRRGLQPVAPKVQLTIRADRKVLDGFGSKGAGTKRRSA